MLCRPKFKVISSIILFLSLFLYVLPSHTASGAVINVIDSGSGSITLEYVSSDIQFSEKIIEGVVYQDAHIPGTGLLLEPGKPMVPFRGTLLAVPADRDIQIELLDSEMETRRGYKISPAPFLYVEEEQGRLKVKKVFSTDAKIYNADRLWPDSPVKIGQEGYSQ